MRYCHWVIERSILSAPDANPAIATNDLMFKGNTTNWIKFANTLKLRLLIHASTTKFDASGGEINSFAPGIDVVAEGAAIAAEGSGFIEAGETAQIEPGYSVQNLILTTGLIALQKPVRLLHLEM